MRIASPELHAFNIDTFRLPPAEYAPGPFWKWNDDPSPARIIEQLDDMKAHGVETVCLHPMPSAFRPYCFGVGMNTEYLGEAFFDAVSFTCDRARERGMVLWLYDEGGWPSGTACGKVLEGRPDLQSQVCHLNDDGSIEVRLFPGSIHRPPVDRLNPNATRRFIELTHERYSRAVGRHFGRTIRWVFTDEMHFPGALGTRDIPWYDELPEDFLREAGIPLSENILRGAFESDPMALSIQQRMARVHFMRCVTRRFVEACLNPLAEWCRKHGLKLGGHVPSICSPLGAIRNGFGDLSLCLDAFDAPGMDAVWRHIFPGVAAPYAPKQVSSSAHRKGCRRAMSESFAVYGQGLTLEQMKWVTDFQFVRGVNLMVFSEYPLSTSGPRMLGTRTFLSSVNPLWRHFRLWADYTRRLSWLCSLGEPAIEAGIIDHSAGLWAGPAEAVEQANTAMVRALTESQVDYDFLPGMDLAKQATVCSDGVLAIGPMRYGSILLSRMSCPDAATLDLLAHFVESGGRLLVQRGAGASLLRPGQLSDRAAALWSLLQEATPAETPSGNGCVIVDAAIRLAQRIPPVVRAESPAPWLRVMKRRAADHAVYLLVNEDDSSHEISILFNESDTPKELVPETGNMAGVHFERTDGGSVCSVLAFPQYGSRVILFDSREAPPPRCFSPPSDCEIHLKDSWSARRVAVHEIEKDDFIVRQLDDPWQPIDLGDWRGASGEWFSGEAAYRIAFPGEVVPACDALSLRLGDVRYAVEVLVNGTLVGTCGWHPFAVEFSPELVRRHNVLEIRVVNTLANLMLCPKTRDDWAARRQPGYTSGYDDCAVVFERESLASGLFGPVSLVPLYAT